ncbi:MAG: RDD family protein [Halococcoides sp.]
MILKRFEAFFIDVFIVTTISLPVLLFGGLMIGDPTAPSAAIWYSGIPSAIMVVIYKILFEAYTNETIGKRIVDISVSEDHSSDLTLRSSIVRNGFLVVDFLPFGFVGAIVSMMIDDDCRRIGDRVAGTVVTSTTE